MTLADMWPTVRAIGANWQSIGPEMWPFLARSLCFSLAYIVIFSIRFFLAVVFKMEHFRYLVITWWFALVILFLDNYPQFSTPLSAGASFSFYDLLSDKISLGMGLVFLIFGTFKFACMAPSALILARRNDINSYCR